MATIQGVYMALFGRPADPLGLNFFNTATQNGANLTAIGDLAATAEYQNRFIGQSNTQIVTSIYQSLYNRAPDIPGLTFFTNALSNGTLNINNIAIAIYDGAQGSDLTIRALKESAANAFTAAIDTTAEINGYNGTAASASAVAFLAGVTTVAPTPAQINAAVLAATTAVSSTVTITMTSQLGETINGTAANETINAVLNAANPNSATGTFNTGDIVNGGTGTDTMNITVTTAGAVLPAGASISGVEIININQSAATATGVTPTAFAGVQQLWQIDTTAAGGTFVDVPNIGAGVTVGFRGNGQVVNNFTTVATGVDTLNVALDGVLGGSAVGAAETTANSLKTVNVSGSLAAPGNFAMGGFGPSTETYNYSLSSNTNVAINPVGATALANIKTVNFGGSTGDITFNSTAYTNSFTTLNGGSGKDTLTASNATANAATLTVNAGEGNDTINFINTKSALAGASTLTGGGGADKFVLSGGSNLVTAASNANLQANLTTITDFNAAEDTLNITGMVGFGARVAQNVVNGAAVGADLFAVTTAVAGVTAVGQHAFFDFGGDTYLYGNIAGAGLNATDALIQLVGVNTGSLTAANLIG